MLQLYLNVFLCISLERIHLKILKNYPCAGICVKISINQFYEHEHLKVSGAGVLQRK